MTKEGQRSIAGRLIDGSFDIGPSDADASIIQVRISLAEDRLDG
jgi:hypothetical protein